MVDRFMMPTFAKASLSGAVFIYAVVALFSFLLFVGYAVLVKKKQVWFYILYCSVFLVNLGYFLLSVSPKLSLALWANRLSYLGSVFLPFSMLMILWQLCGKKNKCLTVYVLAVLALAIFLIAASPGISDIYYKEVSLVTVNGASALKKVYGPLHPLYLVYLLSYFAAMLWGALRANHKKQLPNRSHAVVLIFAMTVNFAVWLLEQLVDFDFELLSVSYVVSELFLLGLYLVLEELEEKQKTVFASPKETEPLWTEIPDSFEQGLSRLTPTERTVFECYLEGLSTKEVLTKMQIKENTLKYHNRNLYGKLGVSSRKELVGIARLRNQAKQEDK